MTGATHISGLPGFTDLLGLIGAGVLVAAYLGNQAGRLASADWRFPALNLLGSALILVSLVGAFNFPSLVIEVFWLAISAYGLVRAWRSRHGRSPDRNDASTTVPAKSSSPAIGRNRVKS